MYKTIMYVLNIILY